MFSSEKNKGSKFFIALPIEDFKEAALSSSITIEKKHSFLGINENQKDFLNAKSGLKDNQTFSSIKEDKAYQTFNQKKSSKKGKQYT